MSTKGSPQSEVGSKIDKPHTMPCRLQIAVNLRGKISIAANRCCSCTRNFFMATQNMSELISLPLAVLQMPKRLSVINSLHPNCHYLPLPETRSWARCENFRFTLYRSSYVLCKLLGANFFNHNYVHIFVRTYFCMHVRCCQGTANTICSILLG